MTAGNIFKTALANKQAQIGLWLSMAEPYLAEVSATAGFDWLLIDGEHGPNDLRSTLSALQAIAPYRSQPVVRAVSGDVHLIKQLLDIGAQNLLIPMVDTPEQAHQLVLATQYPPRGIRGVAAWWRVHRAGRHAPITSTSRTQRFACWCKRNLCWRWRILKPSARSTA
jgi:4-hydroxy-2-oxoheptanedioate aldolase